VTAADYDFEVDGLYYKITSLTEFTCQVVPGDNSYEGDIVVPEKVSYKSKTLDVTSVYFKDCDNLSSVEIPNTVIELASECFSGCEKLTSVKLPHGITVIPDGCFSSCKSLKSIKIPDNVETIGSSAFYHCESLEKVEWSGLYNVPDYCFSGCYNLKNVKIGEGCETLGERAFAGCSSLESFTMPNTVKTISKFCFIDCSSLKTINLSENLECIGVRAFEDCSAISSFSFPGTLETIEIVEVYLRYMQKVNYWSFSGCSPESLEFHYLKGHDYNSEYDSATPVPVEKYSHDDRKWYTKKAKDWYTCCDGTISYCLSGCKNLYLDKAVNGLYAFEYLEELHLGPNINSVQSMNVSSSLKTILSDNMTPPDISHINLSTQNYTDVLVKVPVEALDSYKSAPVWKKFWNIEGVADVSTIADDTEIHEIQRVSMNGLPVDELYKGLVIVRYSDGTSQKLLQR